MNPSARGARSCAASGARLVLAAALLAACSPDAAPVRRDARTGADSVTVSAETPGANATPDSMETPGANGVSAETPAAGPWTADVVDISPEGGISTLVSVRAARHAGFDRVVWELEGGVPGVHVEYVDEPVRACGSGEPVPLPGDAWLEVRMSPANAHTDAGYATIAERRRATGLPAVLEIVQTCDFEAVVSWVLAVRSPEPFRIIRLDDPSRLAVDVRHPR